MLEYVKDAGLKFNGGLTKREKTVGIVVHHLAGRGRDVKGVHNDEIKAHGWKGIGYNFYVRQDGTVWNGRGLDTVGAHAGRKLGNKGYAEGKNNNNWTVGIGFEGYYHPWKGGKPDTEMPKAQFDAGVRLIKDLLKIYPSIEWVKQHKDMPGTATSCAGDYFPFAEMVAAAMGNVEPEQTTTPKQEEVYITTANLNLRLGPGTENAVYVAVKKGTKLIVTKANYAGTGWHQINYNGKTVYASGNYLKLAAADLVYETTANLNLRTGASTSYAVAAVVTKGTKLIVTQTHYAGTGWHQIKHNGKTVYASGNYLKPV